MTTGLARSSKIPHRGSPAPLASIHFALQVMVWCSRAGFVFFQASRLFNNRSCYLKSAEFLLQDTIRDFSSFSKAISHHQKHYDNKRRAEHVKDRVLNRSTQGDTNKTQSQDKLKSENKMRHRFSKTNRGDRGLWASLQHRASGTPPCVHQDTLTGFNYIFLIS